MPEYLAPGVYVEEVEIGAKPIEGVSTSTAAFIGIAQKGPMNEPALITGWEEFRRTFGDYMKESYLAYAVYGFFSNGGKRCYVVRVADMDAAAKAVEVLKNRAGADLIELSALSEGEWGNHLRVDVEAASSGNTALFLSKLKEDHASGLNTIQLMSTAGIAKGSTIVITNGTESESFQLDADPVGGSVVLPGGATLAHDYLAANSCVYTRVPANSGETTVKSATGFSIGSVIVFESADPNVNPVYLTLTGVNQAQRKLSWNPASLTVDVNGAALVDLKRIKVTMTVKAGSTISGNTIEKDKIEPANEVARLRKGDKIIIRKGPDMETRIISDITADSIQPSAPLSKNYPAGTTLTATVTPITKLAEDIVAANIGEDAVVTLTTGISGLCVNDYITLQKANQSASVECQIAEITDDKHLTLTERPAAGYRAVGTIFIASIREGDDHVVVDLTEGLRVGDLIQIEKEADAKSCVFHITEINGQRLTFTGKPDWPDSNPDIDVTITGKQYLATSVRSQEFKLVLSDDEGNVLETFDKLSISGDSPTYFARDGVVNGMSTLVTLKDMRTPPGTPPSSPDDLPHLVSGIPLKDGDDGIANIEATDYIGEVVNGERTGIIALEPVDEVNILCVPDIMMSFGGGKSSLSPDDVELVQLAMISHCEKMKDRFAILDSLRGYTVQEIQAWRKDNLDSKYAALYYPWIKVRDPIGAENGNTRLVPPSGHMAGIYARSDTERGVHKAPANEVVRDVIELERKITRGEQEILNPDGIDCIRAFPGRGIRVWGARTISSDALWKYINVRRLFLFLEESIEEGTQWVVFEPNDEKLWKRVIRSATDFLTRVWKDGALMGTKAEEAFFVKCDRTTMTQDDIENGRLIILIGVAPVRPAEFVIFRIAQWRGGSEVSE